MYSSVQNIIKLGYAVKKVKTSCNVKLEFGCWLMMLSQNM